MNTELIKVEEKNGEQLVLARELHGKLEVKTKFKDWVKRMIDYGFEEDVDFSSFLSESNGGRPSVEYILKLDMAKEICMIQRSEKGRQFRKYFIEIEKKYKAQTPALPTTYLEALESLVQVEKEKNRLIEEKAVVENKYSNLVHDNKTYTATDIAKELKLGGAPTFNKFLRDIGIQYHQSGCWKLYSNLSAKGYTETKSVEVANGKTVYTMKWTGKGRDWIVNKIMPSIESANHKYHWAFVKYFSK